MIFESAYWKRDLVRRASLLGRNMAQRRWSEASFAKFEQTVMIGFYSVRKLVEAAKLTDALVREPVSTRRYLSKGIPVTRFNSHRLEELYDLDSPARRDLSLLDLCHQFVHSYVFTPVLDESSRLTAIWIASDRQRSRALIGVDVKTVIGIFEKVGNDEVGCMRATFDEGIADYRIENQP